MGDQTVFRDLCLDLGANSVIGMICSSTNELINILAGDGVFEGDIVLDYVSLKGDIEDYRKRISIINELKDISKTTLSVREYVDFCELVLNETNINCGQYKKDLISDFGLTELQDSPVRQLPDSAMTKLNVLIGFLKQPRVVILNDFFVNCSEEDVKTIIDCIRRYARKENVVILFSENHLLLEQVCETVINVPNY